MRKPDWKDDLFVTSAGCPGKVLLLIAGILWSIASVLFASCLHCALFGSIPANVICSWIDEIPVLALGVLLTFVAFGLLSFRAILDSMDKKKQWAGKTYDNVKKEKWEWDVEHISKHAVSYASNVFHIHTVDGYTDAYNYMCFVFSALSFGKIQVQELPEKGDFLDEWKKSISNEQERIRDLCTIWRTGLSDFTLHLKPYELKSPENAWTIGRALGIENMVEAYFAGVPLEDIIA